ncbi:MAG: ABC transporter permease, partial [Acidimicrobiia bacterium]|nr:ABC transporter permease [Acidimicrobiia bacterium]
MARYIAKRIAWGMLTLFLFVTMLFFLVNQLIPGDFTSQFIMTGEQRAELAANLGLDRSLWVQYWDWITALLTGNLGFSFRGYEVAGAVRDALSTSLMVFFVGMMIAFPLGNWLGRIGAWRGRGFFLGSASFVAIVFFTAFPPSLAFLLERALLNGTSAGVFLHTTTIESADWLLPNFRGQPAEPVPGMFTPAQMMWRMAITVLIAALVVYAIDW